MPFNFDEEIDRRDTHCNKWDDMETAYGVSPKDGLAMWVADTDFRPPQAVNDAVIAITEHGVHGYFDKGESARNAVAGWMQRRHNWQLDPGHIFFTHGLGAAIALCVQAFTKKGDGVILFSPVYHSFARYINANERVVVESPLVNVDARYEMDLEALQGNLNGTEKMMILCSPHNPGGQVWRVKELRALAAFCEKNDILLVSDEIHHDLVYAPHKHTVMPLAAPEVKNRLVMLVAPSKTFNIAGGVSGCVIISDPKVRAQFRAASNAAGYTASRYGLTMLEAAYNHGDEYVDDLMDYLAENRRILDEGIQKIPGVRSIKLEATFLAWIDFSGTGMAPKDYKARVEKQARIAVIHGESFGTGGEGFLRFNIGCRRAMVEEAVRRLQEAFSDLQ